MSARRPCWVVIAAGTRRALEPEILHVYSGRALDDEAPVRWEIVQGKGSHLAVIEHEPGSECSGDEELAAALSKKSKQPAYVLWLYEESPRVQAFENGAYAGEIHAWPDDVAAHFGCSFPRMSNARALSADALQPDPPPKVARGEKKIAGWTVAQWKHLMRQSEWGTMLDGASEASVKDVIASLGDDDADVRAIACKLTDVLGVHGLGKHAARGLARLREVASGDRDVNVRAAAEEAARYLAEAVEREEVRAEHPWIRNFSAAAIPQAMAAIDDPRRAVRLEVYSWWSSTWEVPRDVREVVAAKLEARLAQETDELTRDVCQSAIESLNAGD